MNLSQNLRNAATQHIIDDNGVGSGFLKINKAEKDYLDDPGEYTTLSMHVTMIKK